MFGLGLPELIVIFVVILLLFGAKALPEVAKGLGQAIRVFKKEAKEIKEGLDTETESSTEEKSLPTAPEDQDKSSQSA